MIRFISLFAGIGGLDLGLERAGWECVAQVEIDEECRKVLEKHWPEVPKYGDVRDVQGSSLPTADAIIGGFPCQPVSAAGRLKGTSDPRWLWPQAARLVDEVRPRIVLLENVPGVRLRGGGEVVSDLAEMGYDAEWGELSAASVGAPHLRRRFFLVAHTVSQRTRFQSGDTQARGQEREPTDALEPAVVRPRDGKAYAEGTRPDSPDVAHPEIFSLGTRLRAGEPAEFRNGRSGDSGGEVNPWTIEPDVGRVADGVPRRMDRLSQLGNAVVPQVAEALGRLVNEWEHTWHQESNEYLSRSTVDA